MKKSEIKPGEERIYAFLRKRKITVFVLLPVVVIGIAIAMLGLIGYLRLREPINLLSFFLGVPTGVAIAYFSGSPMIRAMADVGWWFVRVPEMYAAFVESDMACRYIIMNVNDPTRWQHFEDLAEMRNQEGGGPKYILLPSGKGIYFLGLFAWPWKYKLKPPWYEQSGDAENPKIEPFRFLELKERSWNLLPEDKGGVVPIVGTHDPIDVVARLFVRTRVFDPYKAGYGTEFIGESIVSEITSRWRRVVAKLFYFAEAEKEGAKAEEYLKINPRIQQRAHLLFLLELGICQKKRDGKGEIIWEDEEQEIPQVQGIEMKIDERTRRIDYGALKDKKWKAARICLDSFGFEILDVEVRDLNPKQDVWDKLQARTVSAAEGAAEAAKAKGEAQAIKIRASAQAAAIQKIGEAEAKALEARANVIKAVPAAKDIIEMDKTIKSAAGSKAAFITIGGGDDPGSKAARDAAAAGEGLDARGGIPVTLTEGSKPDKPDKQPSSEKPAEEKDKKKKSS